jgi:hypothetical protein
MGKELTQKNEDDRPADRTLEPADDLTDIDPADFVDPEEFGYSRLRVHE